MTTRDFKPVHVLLTGGQERHRATILLQNLPLDAAAPIEVVFALYEPSRTDAQNRFFHGPVLKAIAEQAWWGGKVWPPEFWKEYLRRRYLQKSEFVTPEGEIVNTYYSTTELGRKRFAEFLSAVFRDAASEWGVQFPASLVEEAYAQQFLKRAVPALPDPRVIEGTCRRVEPLKGLT